MAMARHKSSETFRITHELELIGCSPQGGILIPLTIFHRCVNNRSLLSESISSKLG